jgi:hypothetical protein
VPEPRFAQSERRSFLVPIILALAALALAVVIAIHFFPATTINAQHIHTDILAKETVFKSQTIVVGTAQTENTLLIASAIKVDNLTRATIYLDGFDLTFSNPDDAQLTAKALTRDEVANAELSFPDLKPLVTNPLLRDTAIEPGKSAQGTIVFSLPIPKTMWEARKVATIQIEIYHQSPVFQDIPKS